MVSVSFQPMLCQASSFDGLPGSVPRSVWVAERKYDGIRAWSCGGKLYNREGDDITALFPEIEVPLATWLVFDGEVVTRESLGGEDDFAGVASRVKTKDAFKVRMLSRVSPCVFVVFDCCCVVDGGVSVERSGRLYERREALEVSLGGDERAGENNVVVADRYDVDRAWELAGECGWEGIVVKNQWSSYWLGKRSFDWLKVKRFQEVSHVFREFEESPSGVVLVDGERRLTVNGKEESELVRKEIRERGCVEVDVQFMPLVSGAWRFPSFRGVKR